MALNIYIIFAVLFLIGAGSLALIFQRQRKDRKIRRRHQIIVFAPSMDDRDEL